LIKPTISVIIANYNDSQYLPYCLKAILAQRLQPIEIIIVDDGSTDASVKVIQSFMHQDPKILLIRNNKNLGAIFAGNKGLSAASGDFFLWASANDWVLPGLFEKTALLLAKYPQCGLCTSLSYLASEDGGNLRPGLTPVVADEPTFFPPANARKILRQAGMWFNSNTTFYNRKAVLATGGFLPELGWYADTFMEQLLALKLGACFLPEPLGVIRDSDSGMAAASRSDIQIYEEMMRRAEELMRIRMQQHFPAGYADEFNRQYHFLIAKHVQRKKNDHFMERHNVLWENLGLAAKPLAKSFLVILSLRNLVVRFFLVLRFRQVFWFRLRKMFVKLSKFKLRASS
jgi:glycosyltransferase involved in cell wall biosynthesis